MPRLRSGLVFMEAEMRTVRYHITLEYVSPVVVTEAPDRYMPMGEEISRKFPDHAEVGQLFFTVFKAQIGYEDIPNVPLNEKGE